MRGDLDNILQHLPHDLERTCAIPPPSQIPDNRYVALVQHNNTTRYATTILREERIVEKRFKTDSPR